MVQVISAGAGGLWVGALADVRLPDDFDVVCVMSAEPPPDAGDDDRIIRFAASDQAPHGDLFRAAHLVASLAESMINLGKRVAICSRGGLNRPALAAALVLHWREGITGEDALALLRERVGPLALSVPALADYARALRPPPPRRPLR